jgi:hypothetical protein
VKHFFLLIPLVIVCVLFATPDTTFSQEAPATATVTTEEGTQVVPIEPTDPFPGVSMEMALALVTMLSPFLTWAVKKAASWVTMNVPKFLLPVISGGIGLLLTWVVSLQTDAGLPWYIYVLVMLAGVGLREFNDRIIVKPVQTLKGNTAGA